MKDVGGVERRDQLGGYELEVHLKILHARPVILTLTINREHRDALVLQHSNKHSADDTRSARDNSALDYSKDQMGWTRTSDSRMPWMTESTGLSIVHAWFRNRPSILSPADSRTAMWSVRNAYVSVNILRSPSSSKPYSTRKEKYQASISASRGGRQIRVRQK